MAGTPDRLWSFHGDRLESFDGTTWTEHPVPGLDGGVFHLRPHDDAVWVASWYGLFDVPLQGPAAQLSDEVTVDIAPLDDGSWVVHRRDTELWRPDGTRSVLLEHQYSRALWVAARGDSIWLAYDRGLWRLEPDGMKARIRRSSDGGPPLRDDYLFDSTGALWSGTTRMPEPDTLTWGKDDGIYGSGRWITAASDGRVCHSAWGGFSMLDADGPLPHPFTGDRTSKVCQDDAGQVLGFRLTEENGYDFTSGERLTPVLRGADCSRSRVGGTWHISDGQLFEVQPLGTSPVVRSWPVPARTNRGVVETHDGTLVLVGDTLACEASVDAVRASEAPDWDCEELPEHVGPAMTCALEVGPGEVWACTEGDGLWQRTAPGTWSRTTRCSRSRRSTAPAPRSAAASGCTRAAPRCGCCGRAASGGWSSASRASPASCAGSAMSTRTPTAMSGRSHPSVPPSCAPTSA